MLFVPCAAMTALAAVMQSVQRRHHEQRSAVRIHAATLRTSSI
jgi:hypothetical protein